MDVLHVLAAVGLVSIVGTFGALIYGCFRKDKSPTFTDDAWNKFAEEKGLDESVIGLGSWDRYKSPIFLEHADEFNEWRQNGMQADAKVKGRITTAAIAGFFTVFVCLIIMIGIEADRTEWHYTVEDTTYVVEKKAEGNSFFGSPSHYVIETEDGKFITLLPGTFTAEKRTKEQYKTK